MCLWLISIVIGVIATAFYKAKHDVNIDELFGLWVIILFWPLFLIIIISCVIVILPWDGLIALFRLILRKKTPADWTIVKFYKSIKKFIQDISSDIFIKKNNKIR
jgi:uncharacterized membrane protein